MKWEPTEARVLHSEPTQCQRLPAAKREPGKERKVSNGTSGVGAVAEKVGALGTED